MIGWRNHIRGDRLEACAIAHQLFATFRLGADGKLGFANSYEIEAGGEMQFWSGMVTPR